MLYVVSACGLLLLAALVAYTTEAGTMSWIKTEVPLILGALQAILALVIAFGVELTEEQIGTILAASAAILAIVARSQVSPKAG